MAVDLDPGHIPSIAALRQIALDNADYDKAANYIDQGAQALQLCHDSGHVSLVELARLREEMLGPTTTAPYLHGKQRSELTPRMKKRRIHSPTEYIATEQWELAEPLLAAIRN